MRIELVWGPTCSGKTTVSVSLALAMNLPVISIDRLQCYPQIGTGTGRPTKEELKSTRREYIVERNLKDGIIDAHEANNILKKKFHRINQKDINV